MLTLFEALVKLRGHRASVHNIIVIKVVIFTHVTSRHTAAFRIKTRLKSKKQKIRSVSFYLKQAMYRFGK